MARLAAWLAGLTVATALAGATRAEVLEISGEFAALARDASLLHSLSIDRFDGQDGVALARSIERALGGTHFELLGGRAGRDRADGSLSGGVTSGVDESSYKQTEKRCVEKKDDKCIRREEIEVRCKRRIVTVAADLRLVDDRSGKVLYSERKPFRDEISWCEGQDPNRTVEEAIAAGIGQIGQWVREDIAPTRSTYTIRVRENTKGLPKDGAQRFKDWVKLTKRDPRGACAGWQAMQAEAPGHPSLVFNLGLCAEQRGDYDAALTLYRDAAQAGASEGREGATRVQRLIDGSADARARAKQS